MTVCGVVSAYTVRVLSSHMPKKELRFGVSDGAGRRAATWKLARGKRVRAISVDKIARRGYNPIVPKVNASSSCSSSRRRDRRGDSVRLVRRGFAVCGEHGKRQSSHREWQVTCRRTAVPAS